MENRLIEITHSEQQKAKKTLKNGNSLGDFWDNIQHTHIHIIGSHKEKRKRKEMKMYLMKLWLKMSRI